MKRLFEEVIQNSWEKSFFTVLQVKSLKSFLLWTTLLK